MIPTVFTSNRTNNDLSRNFINRPYYGQESNRITLPDVNIIEHNDKVEMQVAVPGVDKNDININVEDSVLTISAKDENQNDQEQKPNYLKKEFGYYGFKRAFNISDDLDQDKIEAKQENGVLYITLPKKETAIDKGPRTIDVQ